MIITAETKNLNGDLYKIQIEFSGISDRTDLSVTIVDWKPFEFGSDDTRETVMYPENVKIKLSLINARVWYSKTQQYPNPFSDDPFTDDDYNYTLFKLLDIITYYDASATVYKNGHEYFRGFLDKKNKTIDYEFLGIEITILSNFAKLKEINVAQDADVVAKAIAFSSTNLSTGISYIKLTDAIKAIILKVLPVEKVVLMSNIYWDSYYLFPKIDGTLDRWQVPASQFMMQTSFFFNTGTGLNANWYTNGIDTIKDILNMLGCTGFYEQSKRTFYCLSRSYSNTFPVKTITDHDILKDTSIQCDYSQAVKGMKLYIKGAPGEAKIVQTVEYGDCTNSDDIEEIYISNKGGVLSGQPDNSLNRKGFAVLVPQYYSGIGNVVWLFTTNQSGSNFYSSLNKTKKMFWQVVGDDTWSMISKARNMYIAALNECDYTFDTLFNITGYDTALKAKKITQDEFNETTVIKLIQV